MGLGQLQCIYSFNGERYQHGLVLEIERLDRLAYVLTLVDINHIDSAVIFECHLYVVSALTRGAAFIASDEATEVTLTPTAGMLQIGVRHLNGSQKILSTIADFRLQDLRTALVELEGFLL